MVRLVPRLIQYNHKHVPKQIHHNDDIMCLQAWISQVLYLLRPSTISGMSVNGYDELYANFSV